MKQASVTDLRRRFKKIELWLRKGWGVEVTYRNQVVGRLLPPNITSGRALPDFQARMRRIYGNKVFKVSGAELIARDRDRY
jgi:hypothetical protein